MWSAHSEAQWAPACCHWESHRPANQFNATVQPLLVRTNTEEREQRVNVLYQRVELFRHQSSTDPQSLFRVILKVSDLIELSSVLSCAGLIDPYVTDVCRRCRRSSGSFSYIFRLSRPACFRPIKRSVWSPRLQRAVPFQLFPPASLC